MTSSWASTPWTTRAIPTAARNTSRPSRPWPTWPPRLRWRDAVSPFTRRSSTSPRPRSSGAAPPWGSITLKPFPAIRPTTKAAPVAIARPVACAARASRPPGARTPHATRHPRADLLPGAMDTALPHPATIAWLAFGLEGFRDPTDLLRHLAGGICMGFGGVTALGCTIGQGITGLSTLALGSLLTTASIIVGATLTLRLGARVMDRT